MKPDNTNVISVHTHTHKPVDRVKNNAARSGAVDLGKITMSSTTIRGHFTNLSVLEVSVVQLLTLRVNCKTLE